MTKTKLLAAIASVTALAGCISFGSEPPEQLLTLTPSATIPAGAAAEGEVTAALAVRVPDTTQRLNVTRVPVTTSDSSLAYLQEAFWVEKPAQLFRNVLAETIRAKGNRLVVGGGEMEYAAETQLSGQLVDMGYDATTGSAVVRFDAVLQAADGTVRTRRFEERIEGIPAEADAVGSALNDAANLVADQVAEWVG
ncbi:ABC-type transport auxiliary lipoprotein family protein [Aurantiacibacter poecillastricola]|uniref:ABC-type transport auxiliary lipoprotein family protein n=1 Tax=Aurantiacibacter poecillastricola TaxID=3064385 RepID=UPI00273F86A7|nr:ABC-type transport auxiliary lipoprotein family protein [Aurantiacibacter sp. 219JJ12-13]MDP5262795.1 ABC-type transport auxiliary lipoprotein family protein [Aurantiacibacter sp. 219JJ12-13]